MIQGVSLNDMIKLPKTETEEMVQIFTLKAPYPGFDVTICLGRRLHPMGTVRRERSASCIKGTMSEAELHVLCARLQGGIRNKARRGKLRVPLPVGLVYDMQDEVILDPDQ